jgi:BirA family biotin operon repressor/biotin-[acetyl-CoA-carboxylase] ligase
MPLPLTPRRTVRRARALRRTMTPAEARLWSALRRNALGVRFRRQHPVHPYVADFACFTHRLVKEVDGSMHEGEEAAARDARRDSRLQQEGWRVLRYTNLEIFDDLDVVLDEIGQALRWQERLMEGRSGD